ncbi:hypothetical protein AgCh_007235 [Apium graveolens]
MVERRMCEEMFVSAPYHANPKCSFLIKFVNFDMNSYVKFLKWMPDAFQMPELELIDHAEIDSFVYLWIYLVGYALDVNVEREEDVIIYKKILNVAHDPATRIDSSRLFIFNPIYGIVVVEEIWTTSVFNSKDKTITFSLKDTEVSNKLTSMGYSLNPTKLGEVRRMGLRKEWSFLYDSFV